MENSFSTGSLCRWVDSIYNPPRTRITLNPRGNQIIEKKSWTDWLWLRSREKSIIFASCHLMMTIRRLKWVEAGWGREIKVDTRWKSCLFCCTVGRFTYVPRKPKEWNQFSGGKPEVRHGVGAFGIFLFLSWNSFFIMSNLGGESSKKST